MMLQALMAYAEWQGLGGADGAFFQPVEVHWAIPLTAEGTLAGEPISYASDDPAKKKKTRSFVRPFTSPNELNQGDKSHFLCDSLERAVLFFGRGSFRERRWSARATRILQETAC